METAYNGLLRGLINYLPRATIRAAEAFFSRVFDYPTFILAEERKSSGITTNVPPSKLEPSDVSVSYITSEKGDRSMDRRATK